MGTIASIIACHCHPASQIFPYLYSPMAYRNVLLIDDDLEDHEIFTSAIATVSPNLNLTSFTNARQALQKLLDKELNPDVIFLDLNMPVMTGQEFLKEIKSSEQLQQIPVIIFSTSSNPSTIASTKLLGAADFITKPGGFQTLVDLLKPLF